MTSYQQELKLFDTKYSEKTKILFNIDNILHQQEFNIKNTITLFNNLIDFNNTNRLWYNISSSSDETKKQDNFQIHFTFFHGFFKNNKNFDNINHNLLGFLLGLNLDVYDNLDLGIFTSINKSYLTYEAGYKFLINQMISGAKIKYKMTEKFFMQALSFYSISSINNRFSDENIKLRKPNSIISYGADIMLGYEILLSNQAIITPTLGFFAGKFDYSCNSKNPECKEEINKIKKKENFKVDAILGLNFSQFINLKNIRFIPSISIKISQPINSKNSVLATDQEGGYTLTIPNNNKNSTNYHIGFGFGFHINRLELSLHYNTKIASKLLGHIISFNLSSSF